MSPLNLESLPDSHFKDFFERFATLRQFEDVYRQWSAQTAGRRLSEHSRRCKAIALAACVSEATIRHAFHAHEERRAHVGAELRQRLALMAQFLGLPADPPPPGQRRGSIALLTELDVLSMRFHFELTRSLTIAAAKSALALSLHECPRRAMADVIKSLQVRHDPDAYVLVRLTPDRAALEVLRQTSTPVVLIHADLLCYEPPVLAHVVPDQSDIPAGIARWLEVLEGIRERSAPPKVVVVAVQDEEPAPHDWEPLEAGTPSIRNQRKRLIMEALALHGARPVMEEVKDYSSHCALAVFERHRDADGFVCLSDSLAVGMKHHFIVDRRPWQGRILGFDNTQLAHEEGISSFEQSRSETARLAIEALTRFFDRTGRPGAHGWPEPQLSKVKVSLKLRPEPDRAASPEDRTWAASSFGR